MPGAAAVLDTAQRMMVHGIWLNLILCFFNLIPIPPLDGSHLLYHLAAAQARACWYRGLQRFGYLPLFALMFLFRPVDGVPPDAGVRDDGTPRRAHRPVPGGAAMVEHLLAV